PRAHQHAALARRARDRSALEARAGAAGVRGRARVEAVPVNAPNPHLPDDAGEAQALAAQGGPLLPRRVALLRTARTYDVSNMAFQRQMQELMNVLRRLLDAEEEVQLVAVGDYFYLNGVRVRATTSLMGPYHALLGDFARRQTGGIRFLQGVSEAELERFF